MIPNDLNGGPPPPPAAPGIDPAPVPTDFRFLRAQGSDGTKWVLLKLSTPVGAQVYWFTQDGWDVFVQKAQEIRGGIVVPTMLMGPEVKG